MRARPVAPRASRIADSVASVPELTMRTISQLGTRRAMVSAIVTSSGLGAPKLRPSRAVRDRPRRAPPDGCGRRSSGPRSRRSRCSGCRRRRSGTRLPRAATKNGSPPTDLNARTGELTPPGISVWARANRACERLVSMRWRSREVGGSVEQGAVGARGGDGIGRVEHAADHRDQVGAGGDQRTRIVRRDAADRHPRQAERARLRAAGRGVARRALGLVGEGKNAPKAT